MSEITSDTWAKSKTKKQKNNNNNYLIHRNSVQVHFSQEGKKNYDMYISGKFSEHINTTMAHKL